VLVFGTARPTTRGARARRGHRHFSNPLCGGDTQNRISAWFVPIRIPRGSMFALGQLSTARLHVAIRDAQNHALKNATNRNGVYCTPAISDTECYRRGCSKAHRRSIRTDNATPVHN
jgi:hypothetical protein